MHNVAGESHTDDRKYANNTKEAEMMFDFAKEFYRVFYRRTLDEEMANKVSFLLKESDNPIAAFLENCANSGEFKTRDLYVPVSGQYDTEANTCWFGPNATLVVKRHPVYVSLPHDYPTSQELIVRSDLDNRKIILHPGESYKIRAISELGAQAYSITAKNIYRPSEYGRPDNRALCYQISAGNRNQVVVRDMNVTKTYPDLVAVSGSLKEWRVLSLLVRKLQEIGINCSLFKENDQDFDTHIAGKDNICFIIASADTFFLCERRVDHALYIYAEHGIAPFKGYSYAAHYKNYDHVMLPSDFLRDRIEKLHGQLSSADIVGYPVISTVNIKSSDIDILFAPTWSHNFDHIKAAQTLVETCITSGLRVAYVGHPDSLTGLDQTLKGQLIEIDDIYTALGRAKSVVTDFSSVGIEAAVLGIPIMLMPIFSLDDFERRLYKNGRIKVPHLESKEWDAGPIVNEENIIDEYEKLTGSAEYYQKARQDWAEFCHSVPLNDSLNLSIRSILDFLSRISNKS